MFSLDSVEITVEDAGVAIITEKDEGIGEGLKERLNGGFERLVRLGVMVHYEGLSIQIRQVIPPGEKKEESLQQR